MFSRSCRKQSVRQRTALVTAQEKAANQKRVEVLRELGKGNPKGNKNKIKCKPGN